MVFATGCDQHVRQTRRQGELHHPLAFAGQETAGIERAEARQQCDRLRPGSLGRRIEKPQGSRIRHAPGGKVEREARQIRFQDRRPVVGSKGGGLRFVPEPIAQARLHAPGASTALVGGGTRHAGRFQTGQPGCGLIDGNPRQTAVDDDAHALDGERRLRDGGGEHHLAPAFGRRADGGVLFRAGERAVKRGEVGVGRQVACEQIRRAADLALAGQKGEYGAMLFGKRFSDGGSHLIGRPAPWIAPEIDRLDRKAASFAGNHRCAVQMCGDPLRIDGRGHDQQAQVLAERGLGIEGQRKPEIAIERAFVKLVEEHGRDA